MLHESRGADAVQQRVGYGWRKLVRSASGCVVAAPLRRLDLPKDHAEKERGRQFEIELGVAQLTDGSSALEERTHQLVGTHFTCHAGAALLGRQVTLEIGHQPDEIRMQPMPQE